MKRFWSWLCSLFRKKTPPPVVVVPPPPVEPPPLYIPVLPPDDGKWIVLPHVVPTRLGWILSATIAVEKKDTPMATLAALAAWLRFNGIGAGVMVDSVMIVREDGDWEEYHAVAFTDGGYTLKPFRAVWRYDA